MADDEDEFSTLALRVDLECDECKKRIKKIVCNLQGPMNIRVIKYLEKDNVVILSGPFDPHELTKRLKRLDCKCSVIKDIKIVPLQPKKKEKCKQTRSGDGKHKGQGQDTVEEGKDKEHVPETDGKHKGQVQETGRKSYPVCRCGPCRDDGHCGNQRCRCGSCGFTFVYAGDGPPAIYNSGDVTSSDLAACRSYCDEPNYTCAIM